MDIYENKTIFTERKKISYKIIYEYFLLHLNNKKNTSIRKFPFKIFILEKQNNSETKIFPAEIKNPLGNEDKY